jgi:selenocysteine lyase/cysteine desulfurase
MTVASPDLPLARYRDEFPIFRHTRYLNSCSLGALSERTRAAVGEYLDQWERRGAAAWYDSWLPDVERLRAAYGRLLHAAPDSISLHPSVSSALSVVGESLDYRDRPSVVTTSLDFPTLPYQWLAKADRGVRVVVVESPDATAVPLERMAAAIDSQTVLVATSHVFFTSGAIQDVAALAAICHAHGALLLVDGYQAAGQLPVDVAALGVDFYCGGGLKWLLGGSGIAFLYVRPGLHDKLAPGVTGWFAHAAPFRFDSRHLERAADAHRFDMGTPSVAAVRAQLASLSMIEEIGVGPIRDVTRNLTEDLIASAEHHGMRPKVAPHPDERSAIVMLPREDPHADVRRLAERGFIVDARPGHVRVSPYFYNTLSDHQELLEALLSE